VKGCGCGHGVSALADRLQRPRTRRGQPCHHLGEHVDGVIRVVTLATLLGTLVACRRCQRRPGLDPFPIITRWSAVGLGLGVAIELLSAVS
jgi:hypothetical protein